MRGRAPTMPHPHRLNLQTMKHRIATLWIALAGTLVGYTDDRAKKDAYNRAKGIRRLEKAYKQAEYDLGIAVTSFFRETSLT